MIALPLRTLRVNRKNVNALEGGKILKAGGEGIYEDTMMMVIHLHLIAQFQLQGLQTTKVMVRS
jgi:hypothetical protein